MNTKLGMLKQVAVAACFAASVGALAVPAARAESSYSVSVGTAPAYYGDYYYAPPYNPRCYYDYYGYYRCRPYYAYYGGPYYYGPAISFGYYRGWSGWRGRDWDDRIGFRRWRR